MPKSPPLSRALSLYSLLTGISRKKFYGVDDALNITAKCLGENAYVLQIGSNDGIMDDPLRDYIVTMKWQGVLIEPIPYLFERLKNNYKDTSGIFFENCAVADRPGERTIYRLNEAPGHLPAWHGLIGSFDPLFADKFVRLIPDIQDRIVAETVKCTTFSDLMLKHQRTSADILHIDTEGYDFEIIKSIDFSRFSIALILFEHQHLSTSDQLAAEALLHAHHYRTIRLGVDTLAWKS